MVSKVYPMRSHTVSAEGGAAGVSRKDDTLDEHAYDTISGSDWLGDQDCGRDLRATKFPKSCCAWSIGDAPGAASRDGRIAVRPFGGMKKMRTWFAADKTGFHMLHTLFQTSLQYGSITRYDETFATSCWSRTASVQGVVAIELRPARSARFTAKAVIICTGGCGRVFPFTTNANICTGDGMALAYRAGAPLKDMEMAQYHPTGLPFTGILITEAARAEGGWLLNKDGYRYPAGLRPRQADAHAGAAQHGTGTARPRVAGDSSGVREGARVPGPYGDYVHLDLRHLGEHKIESPAADGARAVPQVRKSRSGEGADSGAARAALHDGRRAYRYRRRDAARRTCTPRARRPA